MEQQPGILTRIKITKLAQRHIGMIRLHQRVMLGQRMSWGRPWRGTPRRIESPSQLALHTDRREVSAE